VIRPALVQHAFQYGWDRSRSPVLSVKSGAEVSLDLNDASDGQIGPEDDAKVIERIDRKRMNPLAGPIAVDGARPGSVIQVDILEVNPGPRGWTAIFPRFGLLADDFPDAALVTWSVGDQFAESSGLRLRTAPFCGVIGVAPAEPGTHSVVPPRNVGGNMDTKQLVAGATLFLPIEVEGALLGVGDAHALQGDGEVCGTALEVGAHAVLRLVVRDDLFLQSPAFIVPRGPANSGPTFATTGVEPDLYQAARAAIRRMIDHLGREHGFSPAFAYMMCSLLVDLRISEVVDRPNWVVSALWPTTAIS
jgi:acetamidase/formamidase